MKRLMVMLSAAAMAFGLFAADEGHKAGTGFEDGLAPAAPAWNVPSDDTNQVLNVTAYDGDAPEIQRPAQYQGEENAKFLDVRTSFGKPVELNVSDATMGGIYFDSLVKFTACDDDPADGSYAGAKLIVYTKEIEGDPVSTKLFVKGGLLASDGSVTPKVFDCGNWTKGDAWVRLTIKSIANVAKSGMVPGFVVFVDGEAVSADDCVADGATFAFNDIGAYWNDYNSANSLIPSLISLTDQDFATEAGRIAKVGFDGQGKIDDLSFTTTVPSFCADPAFFTFTWDENVAGVKYQFGLTSPVELTPDQLAKGSIAIPYIDEESCTIIVTPKDGFVIDSWTGSPTTSGNAGTFVLAAGGIAGGVTTKANEPRMSYSINGTPAGTATSFADLIGKLASIQGTDVVKVSLTDNVEAGADEGGYSEINFSNGIITLDLAGKTITGVGDCSSTYDSVIYVNTALTIIDSVGGGKVVIGEGGAYDGALYVDSDGTATIGALSGDLGATFEGKIADNDGGTISIVRGKFDDDSAKSFIDENSECSAEKDSDGYWVVAPKAVEKHGWAIYLAKGENENEFLIQDKQNLIDLATWANKTDGDGETFPTEGITFTQTKNIDLENSSVKIGDEATGNAFKGTYDGGNFEISNLVVAPIDKDHWTALFANIDGATIKNLTVSGTTGDTKEAPFYRGALVVGIATGNVTMKNVTSSGTVTGNHNLGGMFGRFKLGTLNFIACTNHAEVTGNYSKLGGLFVYSDTSGGTVNFTDCLNDGAITATGAEATAGAKVGGIACGTWASGVTYTFTRCRNEGAISGTQVVCKSPANYSVKIGGIVGQLSTATVFEDCTNTGAIYGNSGNVEGGSVSADAEIGGVGGICGQAASGVTFKGTVENLGTVTSVVKENASRVKCGNLIGNNNAVTIAEDAVVKASATMDPAGNAEAALKFATVENDVATFGAFADGCTVMMSASLADQKIAKGETLTVYERVAGLITAAPTTDVAGYEVVKNDNVYSLAAKTYNITFTSQDGTKAPEAMTYTVESEFPLALADATTENDSIEFKGWTNETYTTAIKAIPELPETLGDIALVAQWDAVVGPEDWDKPVTPIVPGETKAADAWPTLKDTPLAQADASKLVTWAKDTTKGNITLDQAAEIKVEAFLLDCANTERAVDDAKKAFKVTSITQDEDGKWVAKVGEAGEGDGYKNGYITIVPYDLEGAGDDAEFFQAQLLLQPAE